jgi:MFS family permease
VTERSAIAIATVLGVLGGAVFGLGSVDFAVTSLGEVGEGHDAFVAAVYHAAVGFGGVAGILGARHGVRPLSKARRLALAFLGLLLVGVALSTWADGLYGLWTSVVVGAGLVLVGICCKWVGELFVVGRTSRA